MIDGIINNGAKTNDAAQKSKQSEPPLSVVDLAGTAKKDKAQEKAKPRQRTSVLAKLHAYQQEDNPKTTMHKSAERDL
jgi:hypothetical protein